MELETEVAILREKHIDPLQTDIDKLKMAVDAYVLTHEHAETPTMKLTRVQGFKRRWNTASLEKILPRGIFKNLVTYEVDPAKVDEYVRSGRIDRKKIEAAFEESPNAPYVKWTAKRAGADGEAEAESLAAKLA